LLRQTLKGDAQALVTPQNIQTAPLMILFTFDADKMEPLLKSFLPKFPTIHRNVGNATASFAAENIILAAAAFGLGSVVMTNIMPAASFA
jgi:nitroreductase